MLLKLPEDLLTQGIGNLSVDAGVLDVFAAQVVGHVLDAAAGLQSPNGDPVVAKVHIVDGEHERLTHTETVVVDQAEESPIAWRVDGRKEVFQFILGEVFGEGSHTISIAPFTHTV
jgi:hypothetical protein